MMGYMVNRKSNRLSDRQVRIIVKFNGKLDEAALAKAVRLMFDAEPVTGCRLVEKPLRPYWQRCRGLEKSFEFHQVDPSEGEAEGIYEYLLAPMDPSAGPQVRASLFRSDHDTLYIKMSHILADAGAAIDYLTLLSGIYRRLLRDPEYRPASNLHGSRSAFQALRHAGIRKIISSFPHVAVPSPAWKLPTSGSEGAKPRLVVRRMKPERVSRIKAYAKSRGATMGDALIAACYLSLFKTITHTKNVPLPLFVPVNLRKYIPGGRGEGICSLTAGYLLEMEMRDDAPFEVTLASVHAAMEAHKASRKELGQALVVEVVFSLGYMMPLILGPVISPSLIIPTFSNIGVVDPGAANFGVPLGEILMVGPMVTPPNFVVGSSTFNGELAITLVIHCTDAFYANVERFFDEMLNTLPE